MSYHKETNTHCELQRRLTTARQCRMIRIARAHGFDASPILADDSVCVRRPYYSDRVGTPCSGVPGLFHGVHEIPAHTFQELYAAIV